MPKQQELTRTGIHPDPVKSSRFVRGVLFGKSDETYTEMQVWFYHNKQDAEPYFVTRYGLHGSDHTFVAYHRRSLFHGLLNKMARKHAPGKN